MVFITTLLDKNGPQMAFFSPGIHLFKYVGRVCQTSVSTESVGVLNEDVTVVDGVRAPSKKYLKIFLSLSTTNLTNSVVPMSKS